MSLAKVRTACQAYREKRSDGVNTALQQAASKYLRGQALRNALKTGLLGLGAGVAGRGVVGLFNQTQRNIMPSGIGPAQLNMPGPPIEEEEEKFAELSWTPPSLTDAVKRNPWAFGGALAAAAAGAYGNYSLYSLANRHNKKHGNPFYPRDAARDVMKEEKEKEEKEKEEKESSSIGQTAADFMKGDFASTTAGVPWAMPAAVAAGAGGLYGGWKLQDWLMKKQREKEMDDELTTAKDDYTRALGAMQFGKGAEEGSLAADLDELYNRYEKQAATGGDILGQLAGMYLTLAGGSALLAGGAGYGIGKTRRRRELLGKAQKQRRREQTKKRPNPLFIQQATPLQRDVSTTGEETQFQAAPSMAFQESDAIDKE
jgi:hypothetical protein